MKGKEYHSRKWDQGGIFPPTLLLSSWLLHSQRPGPPRLAFLHLHNSRLH